MLPCVLLRWKWLEGCRRNLTEGPPWESRYIPLLSLNSPFLGAPRVRSTIPGTTEMEASPHVDSIPNEVDMI
jgi:hypothetical protein